MSIMEALNPRAVIGANNPPPDPLTPFQIAEKVVNDIYDETVLWLDGKAIDCQDLADGVGNLLTKIREAEKQADAARVAEKAALDEKVKEIQAKYAPLIADTKATKGKTVLAAQACKDALTPWLALVKQRQDEEARIARERADEARRQAEEALRATDAANLAEREAAEQLVVAAKRAETIATKAEHAKPQAGGTFGRSIGLKTVWTATMTDSAKAGKWGWTHHKPEILEFITGLAQKDATAGKREIEGFAIIEEKRAV